MTAIRFWEATLTFCPGDNTNISYIEDVKYTINFDGDLFDNGAASTVEGNNIVRHHRYFLDSCSKGYDANLTITADTENYGLEVSEGEPGAAMQRPSFLRQCGSIL